MKTTVLIAAAGVTFIAGDALGQETFEMPAPGRRVETMVMERGVHAAGAQMEVLSGEFGVSGKVVKNAPYSAESINEQTQVLADGNRIARKTSASVYRDSEGRTRREVTLSSVGPWASSQGEAPRFVFIHDPVANASYTLDPKNRIARKMAGHGFVVHDKIGDKIVSSTGSQVRVPAPPPPAPPPPVHATDDVVFESAPAVVGTAPVMMSFHANDAGRAKSESLGKRNIEGVECEGTKTTITIPAGEIGNERPIDIVSERWYSPELQTVVLSKHSDPRMGETTFRLTNLRRSEPLPSLFEPPADYKLETREAPMMRKLRIER